MRSIVIAVVLGLLAAGCAAAAPPEVTEPNQRYTESVELPEPNLTGPVSVEAALASRRSGRQFADRRLSPDVVGQLLWSGQGITDAQGRRTAPSAGALYPIELYGLTATDTFHYLPAAHELEQRSNDQTLSELGDASFDQQWITTAPLVIVVTGVVARTEAKYGGVAYDLMLRESGHVVQNILLQATALGLAAVPVGGFDPAVIERLMAFPPGEEPLYLIPVGYPR